MGVRRASVVWGVLSILFGWTLFLYWWAVVLTRNDPASVLTTVAAVIFIADALVVAVWLWVAHNRRLAEKGFRGCSSRFRVAVHDRDRLDRRLVLPEQKQLFGAQVIVVTATPSEKRYTPVQKART